MNRFSMYSLILLMVVSFPAVSLWAQRQMELPSTPVSISGIVRDAVSHQPVAFARVILEAERAGYASEATTDAQGKFHFEQLAHVVYKVRIQQPGYKGTDQRTNACDFSACRRVDLSLQSMEYLDFNLVPLAGASAVPPGGPAATLDADPNVPEAARQELQKGREILDTGKNQGDSIPHFKKAIELYPSYSQAYFRLGLAYMDQKDWKKAEEALKKSTDLNANHAGAQLALGMTYAQEQNFAAAETALTKGLAMDPDVADAQCELSRSLWALRKFPESDEHAQKCATLKPDYPPAHLLLGNLALAKRDKPGALREYREYLRLAPDGGYAAPVRQQIDKLEKELGTASAK